MANEPPFSFVDYRIDQDMIDTPTFSYAGFQVLPEGTVPEKNQFDVYLNGEQLVLDAGYTVDNINNEITVSATLELDDYLRIQRDTKKDDLYVDFQDSSFLTEEDLDLDFKQVFFIAQEAFDLAWESIRKTPDGLYWNGQGLEANDFAPATQNNSLVTLGQVFNLLDGSLTASIDGCMVFGFTGDGVQDSLDLSGAPRSINACNVIVTVDGVMLEPPCCPDCGLAGGGGGGGGGGGEGGGGSTGGPVSDFTGESTSSGCGQFDIEYVGGNPVLVFDEAPANGASVSVRILTGTVAAVFEDGSIFGEKIADNAITLEKMAHYTNVGQGKRYLQYDADTGTPQLGKLDPSDLTSFQTWTKNNLRLSDLKVPNTDVDFGTYRITGVSAGVNSMDVVNVGQLNGLIGTEVGPLYTWKTTIDNKIRGGYDQNYYGIQPDLYYNNNSHARNGSGVQFVGVAAKMLGTDASTTMLMQGFVPRRLRIMISGSIRNMDGTTHVGGTTTREFEFYRWDTENGFTPEAGASGNIKTYALTPLTPGTSDDQSVATTSFELDIEFVFPFRVWLRMKRSDTGDLLKLIKPGEASGSDLPGSIQVIAERGF